MSDDERERRAKVAAVIEALGAVYSGAGVLEAEALLDQLEDEGWSVERWDSDS